MRKIFYIEKYIKFFKYIKNCQKLQKFRQNYRKKSTKFKITFQKNKKINDLLKNKIH